MMGRVFWGPWPLPLVYLEGVTFASLTVDQQRDVLTYAIHDLRRYWTDLPAGEVDSLKRQVRNVRPLRVVDMSAAERARLAAALLPILQRRAGWAA